MRFTLPRPRGLRWRLTLYYTLGMLATLILFQILVLSGLAWATTRGRRVSQMVAYTAQQMALPVAVFLRDVPQDRDALTVWLTRSVPLREGGSGLPGLPLPVPQDEAVPSSLPRRYDLAAVVASDGSLLASNVPSALRGGWTTEPFVDPRAPAVSRSLIQDALQGMGRVVRQPGGVVLAAEPIYGEEGSVVGALYLRVVSVAPGARFWQTAIRLLGSVSVILSITRIILAGLFGFITAYWLSRRLGRLARVTQAWGQGDFSARAEDKGQDEIGELAARLNRMAEDVQSLMEMRKELASLEERNRLARELHDSVKQQVFATAMQVAAARTLMASQPDRAVELMEQAETLANQAQEELNALLRQLRPPALAGQGLVPALREYLSTWTQHTGIHGEGHFRSVRRIPLHVEQTLFRVVQEALANVAKHSQATRVEVGLHWQGSTLVLWVEDDGQGFDLQAVQGKGMGLVSMRERVQDLGGVMSISSRPSQGTRVEIRVPSQD